MYVVTGGAGFIGSNVVAALAAGGGEIVVSDWLRSDERWRNLAKHEIAALIAPDDLPAWLRHNRASVEAVIHLGAISATTETNVDLIVSHNIRHTLALLDWCTEAQVRFIYASSAATYGDGAQGFADRFDEANLSQLRPLNPYGWSKHLFDRWVAREIENGAKTPPRWAGLKFFNVYGPNEYHKGGQRSVAVQLYEQICSRGFVRLFKSDNPDYADGEQQRDFVWVGDCVNVALWALQEASARSGLYNVGSGKARSFMDKARIIFAEMNREQRVEFIDLPENLRGKYQYYTCADMEKLRAAGFTKSMTSLEDGLGLYIHRSLETGDRFL